MTNRKAYSYSILRYVHDVATSEFINVGVAVHCKDENHFQVMCRTTLGRIGETFPNVDAKAFRALMRTVSKRYSDISDAYGDQLGLGKKEYSIDQLLQMVTPTDDSALIWTSASGGLTVDPSKTVLSLYQRYVTKYDSRPVASKRTDGDVWKAFHRGLQDRRIEGFFSEKTIESQHDEVKFKSAWKNGIWHCIEPISFDLSAPDTIREKAHKFLGQITSVKESSEQFKIYLVLAQPEKAELNAAFLSACNILDKLPIEKEIYLESEKDTLLDSLKSQITAHELLI